VWQVAFTSQVQMFFSPVILSYATLKRKLHEEFHCITCDDGKLFLFQECKEHLLIGERNCIANTVVLVLRLFEYFLILGIFGIESGIDTFCGDDFLCIQCQSYTDNKIFCLIRLVLLGE